MAVRNDGPLATICAALAIVCVAVLNVASFATGHASASGATGVKTMVGEDRRDETRGGTDDPGWATNLWGTLFAEAAKDAALRTQVDALKAKALAILDEPLCKRLYRFEDLEDPDTRSHAIRNRVQREVFALSISDHRNAAVVRGQLSVCAAAFLLTGKKPFADRVRSQLQEMTSWHPIQRGGWTLYDNFAKMPGDWKTNSLWGGSWLATGNGVQAIVDMLTLMPRSEIPADLRRRLHRLLEAEIRQIVQDWRIKRQWFIKSDNALTNQWVLPTQGLILACLALGREEYAEEYELGVRNILKTLEAQNADGSYAEGWGYATGLTIPALLSVGRAMASHHDRRVLDHPFIRRSPRWLLHQLQPGRQYVQSFDNQSAARGMGDHALRSLFCRFAVTTGSADARWLLQNRFRALPADRWGLAAAMLTAPEGYTPPLFASYDGTRTVMWRSSWSEDADGVWMRGGHPRDQHDHRDRGHISYTAGGIPILIECGTPGYGHKAIESHFKSSAGHNVLQLGDGAMPKPAMISSEFHLPAGWQQKGVIAPVRVLRLDKQGGDVEIVLTSGYDGLSEWRRRITWDRKGVTVVDNVKTKAPQVVLFRWHLGTNEEATLEGATAQWSDATLTAASDTPLTVRQTRRRDHTLEARNFEHKHACIIVRTKEPVRHVAIRTRVVARKSQPAEGNPSSTVPVAVLADRSLSIASSGQPRRTSLDLVRDDSGVTGCL
jgi:hypothetical protein